jgi:hypothetical protein
MALFTQVPPGLEQLSAVHGFLSSHLAVSAAYLQPVAVEQESVVHPSPSLQTLVVPLQVESLQVSVSVQALLSLQPNVLDLKVQPTLVVQPSSVQLLPSLQLAVPWPLLQTLAAQ